jgi:SNF2 family DNA or RNA helicase
MLDVLEDYLNARCLAFGRIDGSITGDKRQAAIDEFTKPDSPLSVMVRTRHATHLRMYIRTTT